jgi:pimeloyl-ACP methyl ester carboxylesterase
MNRVITAAVAASLLAGIVKAQDTKSPDDRIHVERIDGGTTLMRDIAGDYSQHPKVFIALMAVRDRLFTPVGACFGIYPQDPDAVESPAELHWEIGVRVSPRAAAKKLTAPPKPYRIAKLPAIDAAVIETNVQTAAIDGLAMFRWMAEHGYVQVAPTRIEYLSHEGSPMLLPVKIIVPVKKRRSGLTLPARSGVGEVPAMQLDSSLDNLQHTPGYRASPLGSIGEIVRRGAGPVDVVLIPGWGFGAKVFDQFMADNASRFRMIAVTLPGFGTTTAPPMPPRETSYADQTWTRAAEEAVAQLIVSEHLHRPVLVGHFIVGTQIALRMAIDHPELISGVVAMAGAPLSPMASRRDSTGKTSATYDERVRGIDGYLAPRFFKMVPKLAWDQNNFSEVLYARDSAHAAELWRLSASVPVPVMVRYLCEFYASDMSREYAQIRVPTIALIPGFSAELLADTRQRNVKPLFMDSWASAAGANPLLSVRMVPGSRIFITDDQPDAVRAAIQELSRQKMATKR